MSKKALITKYLLDEGFNPSFDGFTYLVDAIESYKPLTSITKEVYVNTANKFNTIPTRVERAIRYAKEGTVHRNVKNAALIARIHLELFMEDYE